MQFVWYIVSESFRDGIGVIPSQNYRLQAIPASVIINQSGQKPRTLKDYVLSRYLLAVAALRARIGVKFK